MGIRQNAELKEMQQTLELLTETVSDLKRQFPQFKDMLDQLNTRMEMQEATRRAPAKRKT